MGRVERRASEERKEKGKKRVEEISQGERKKIREEEKSTKFCALKEL